MNGFVSEVCYECVCGAGIERVAEAMKDSIPNVEWDFEGIHYFDNGPLTVQYLLVLDALNFCFWPGGYHFFNICSAQFVLYSEFSIDSLPKKEEDDN